MALATIFAIPGAVAACKILGEAESVVRGDAAALAAAEAEASPFTPVERRGRELWYKAAAGSERFLGPVWRQRFAAMPDFNRALGAGTRGRRFGRFGMIADPDCSAGDDRSFGWDVCPGDEGESGLLAHVGRTGFRDPACDLNESDVEGASLRREDSCELAFGTSAGAIGFRKFPNPRFRRDAWPGWGGFRPADAGVEPPFLIGLTCAACHAGFDPAKAPADPERPEWLEIKGLVGNPFLRFGNLWATAFAKDTPAWQVHVHARAGTAPTTLLPSTLAGDYAGIPPLAALAARPPYPEAASGKPNRPFEHEVRRWRRIDSCAGQVPAQCACVGKGCWQLGVRSELVFQLGRGGEDSAGIDLAVQRGFLGIGMCAEACWLNTLDERGGAPIDVGQCRRSCGAWRAVEDRIFDVVAFMLTGKSVELADAMGLSHEELVNRRDIGGRDRWEKGKKLFARACARCHSSQRPTVPGQPRDGEFFETLDFHRRGDDGLRLDWLGSDEPIAVTDVGTQRCRALYSGHASGRLFEAFASETYRARTLPAGVPELARGNIPGGPGYQRAPSLLGIWARAPFFANRALGAEVCGEGVDSAVDCLRPDPSVAGRLAAFSRAVDRLLAPEARGRKLRRSDRKVVIEVALPAGGSPPRPALAQVELAQGVPITLLDGLTPARLLAAVEAEGDGAGTIDWASVRTRLGREPAFRDAVLGRAAPCSDVSEDGGHRFGAELSDDDKQALIGFLKTL